MWNDTQFRYDSLKCIFIDSIALPLTTALDEQLGQDGSGSEDLSQKGHQPPPQSIGCVYASFAHSSLFNSKTSGGWNSWSWNTQANATAGSWDKEESTGVVNDRYFMLNRRNGFAATIITILTFNYSLYIYTGQHCFYAPPVPMIVISVVVWH